MHKTLRPVILVLFLFIVYILPVNAHLDGGTDKKTGEYLIDFGFSPEHLEAGDKSVLAFNLVKEKNEEIVEPESVWVRISSPDMVVFSGTFKPEAKHVVFEYVFPEPGEYEIFVKFKVGENNTLHETFKINVKGKSEEKIHKESGVGNEEIKVGEIIVVFLLVILFLIMIKRIQE